MRETDRARCLINLLPSEDVCFLKSRANDDHKGERTREGGGAVMQRKRVWGMISDRASKLLCGLTN